MRRGRRAAWCNSRRGARRRQRHRSHARRTQRQRGVDVRLARAPRGRGRLQLVAPVPRHGADRHGPLRRLLGEPPVVGPFRPRAPDARSLPGRSWQLDPRLHRVPGHFHDLTPVRAASGRTRLSSVGRVRSLVTAEPRRRERTCAGRRPAGVRSCCGRCRPVAVPRCPRATGWRRRRWRCRSIGRPHRGAPSGSTAMRWPGGSGGRWRRVAPRSCPAVLRSSTPRSGRQVADRWESFEIRSPSLLSRYVGEDSSPLTADGWLHTAGPRLRPRR